MKGCNFREVYISGWKDNILKISVLKFSSVSCVQLFVTPMDCSTPGFPIHHQLPELA